MRIQVKNSGNSSTVLVPAIFQDRSLMVFKTVVLNIYYTKNHLLKNDIGECGSMAQWVNYLICVLAFLLL